MARPPPGINQPLESALKSNESSRFKPLQLQLVVVKDLPSRRIGRQKNLKASVEKKTVDPLGAHSSSDFLGGLPRI